MPDISLFTADLRIAMRIWIHRPVLTTTVVLTLALGIGSTTAIFSIVNAVLLRPSPWPAADRLVAIYAVFPERRSNPAYLKSWNRAPISWGAWQDLRRAPAFEDVGVWFTQPQIFGDARTDVVNVMYASSSFLSLLGVRPSLGRLFAPEEDSVESGSVLISHDVWRRHFGGRSDVLGQTMILAQDAQSPGALKMIIGILDPTFRFQGKSPDFILPMGLMANVGSVETSQFFRAIGRLAPGIRLEAASVVAEPLVRRLDSPNRRSARLVSLVDDQLGDADRPLWFMLAGSGLLLALANSSAALLLIGEVRGRRQEIAIRTAFGCDGRHMLRQLIIEHLLLGAAATCLGLALAACFTKVLVAMIPAGLIGLETIVFDVRVGVFSLCIGLLTALSFGLAPTVVFSSSKAAEALSGGSHVVTPPSRSGRRALVAAQFGLAFVLLLAAVVFGETLVRLATQPLGFDPSNLAIATIKLTQYPNAGPPLGQKPIPLIKTPADIATARIESVRWMSLGWIHTDGVIDRLSALPGIISIAGASAAPFTGTIDHTGIRAYGHPPEEDQIVQRQVVTEGYFKTMRIPILRGRTFSPSDRVGPLVAVVSQELERRFFDGNALGKRLTQGPFIYEVIGVVSNVKQIGISEEDWATLYELNLAFGSINHLIIRTSGNTIPVMPIIRQMIHDYDSKMVVTSTSTMMDLLAGSIADQRLRALLSAVFGSAALVLAAIGLFGLSAQLTAERRREIAVRVALGARPREVYALVLHDAWIVIGLGVVGGLPVAYAASKVARSFLFGVSPTAPHVFLIAISILAAVATIATSIPAHRATCIDPMLALRE